MALPVPAYITNAQVATNSIRYPWDEWNVNDYFIELDEDQFERLDMLSDAANLALAIGCGEWICHRFSTVSDDPEPYHYLEAAWAAIVYPGYCNRRFAHFPPNLLKSLDRAFENLVSIPLESIEYKGLIEMAEPRAVNMSRLMMMSGGGLSVVRST
jgi:hypothetical protein